MSPITPFEDTLNLVGLGFENVSSEAELGRSLSKQCLDNANQICLSSIEEFTGFRPSM